MAERKSLFSTKTLSQAESIMSDLINVKSNHNKNHTISKKKNKTSELEVTRVNNLNKPVIEKEKTRDMVEKHLGLIMLSINKLLMTPQKIKQKI